MKTSLSLVIFFFCCLSVFATKPPVLCGYVLRNQIVKITTDFLHTHWKPYFRLSTFFVAFPGQKEYIILWGSSGSTPFLSFRVIWGHLYPCSAVTVQGMGYTLDKGLWEETRVPVEKPNMHRENIRTLLKGSLAMMQSDNPLSERQQLNQLSQHAASSRKVRCQVKVLCLLLEKFCLFFKGIHD